jgi:hypothetical protein
MNAGPRLESGSRYRFPKAKGGSAWSKGNSPPVKLALAIGAGSEGPVHSHVRRGVDEGISAAEMQYVALLAIPTLGLPNAIGGMTWIDGLCGKE